MIHLMLLTSLSFAPQVRTADPVVARMLEDGTSGSAEFRALVAAIERTDVIVHIERKPFNRHNLAGMTRFVVRAGGVRYLRITLDSALRGHQAVKMLAHELQHVNEIAQATWVVDRAGLRQLLTTIGYESCAPRTCFDTAAAVQAGHTVWRELQQASSH
jgi:hypothetical protein